jgi:lipoprotein-anchoring transpeptidase ErfK/SrfK
MAAETAWAQAAPGLSERRASPRRAAHRAALITGPGYPQTATVMDVSLAGMRLQAARPVPPGTPVEVEVSAPDKPMPMMFRGTVVRSDVHAPGDTELGVRVMPPKPTLTNHAAQAAAPRPLPEPVPQATGVSPAPRDHRTRVLVIPIVLVLLVVVSGPLARRVTGAMTGLASGLDGAEPGVPLGAAPIEESSGPVGRADIARAGMGDFVAIPRPRLPKVPSVPAAIQVQPMAALVPAGEGTLPVPPPGPGGSGQIAAFAASPGGMEEAPDFVWEYAPAPARQVRLTVSKSRHEVTVHAEGEPVRRFPVGLGEGDSTPGGVFTIANKIVDPEWYNRGDPVKAGDPRNPLGSRWMGLAHGGTRIPVGFHATDDPSSIGRNEGLGCIRMHPADVEALFDLCQPGTPVTILP